MLLIEQYNVNPKYIFEGQEPIINDSSSVNKETHQFHIPIHHAIRTAVKQYLVYFNDYITNTRGNLARIEVKNSDEGILIEFPIEDDATDMALWIEEYLSFIKQKVDEINPNVQIEVSETKKDIFILELKNQIRFLQNSLEIKILENKYLNENVEFFKKLLISEKHNPTPIIIQSNNNIPIQNYNTQNIEQTFDINTENLSQIYSLLGEIKSEIINNKQLDSEIQQDTIELFQELEKEIPKGNVRKGLIDKILDKSSKISSIGSFVINLIRILNFVG